MKKQGVRRIAIDIDDTLILERDYVRSGFRAVGEWLLANHGASGFFEMAWEYFLAGRRNDIFNRVLQRIGLEDNNLVLKMVEVYRSHAPSIKLLPDAMSFFKNHTPADLGIISDGHSVSQWAKVRVLGLKAFAGSIIITNDWGREYWKPHPRAFEVAQQGYLPSNCVYIADNPLKDFLAPAKLGWFPSIRIRRAGSLYEDIATPGDCIEVTSLNDISSILSLSS